MATAVGPQSVPGVRRPSPPVLEQYGRLWRWLTILASLAVVVAFFLPMTGTRYTIRTQVAPDSFNMGQETFPDVPALICVDIARRLAAVPFSWWAASLYEVLVLTLFLICPTFWGLMMILYSASQLAGWQRTRRAIWRLGAWGSLIVTVPCWCVLVYMIAQALRQSVVWATPMLVWQLMIYGIFVGAILGGQLYAIFALRRGAWGYLYHGFVAAMLTVLLFATMLLIMLSSGSAPQGYGLFTSMVAWAVLLVSRIGEARAVSRASWFGTLIGLSFLRLEKRTIPAGHCPDCAYNLAGNISGICPECGRPAASA